MNNFSILDCAKAPRLSDCKQGRIELILPLFAIVQPRELSLLSKIEKLFIYGPLALDPEALITVY